MGISTVIVTADRDVGTVCRALLSVISQTVSVEVVLVDSGHVENVALRQWVSDYFPLIKYVTLNGSSAPDARNLGASMCDSDIICFLDDDDEWYPEKIEHQIQSMKGNVCLVSTPYVVEHSDHDSKFIPRNADMNNILGENMLGSTSFVMLSKKVFDRVGGFDPRLKANQEWDLWMRMLLHGDSAISGGCAGIKHHSETSITTNHGKRRDGWRTLIRKHKSQYLRNPKAMLTAFNFYRNEMRSYGFVLDYLIGTIGCFIAMVLKAIRK